MSRNRKFSLITTGNILTYLLSFGPIWGWYMARNKESAHTCSPISGFYAPILAAFKVPGLAIPFVVYLYLWERIYGGH